MIPVCKRCNNLNKDFQFWWDCSMPYFGDGSQHIYTQNCIDRRFWQKINDKFLQFIVRICHVSLIFGMLYSNFYITSIFPTKIINVSLSVCAILCALWYKSDTSPWRMLYLLCQKHLGNVNLYMQDVIPVVTSGSVLAIND